VKTIGNTRRCKIKARTGDTKKGIEDSREGELKVIKRGGEIKKRNVLKSDAKLNRTMFEDISIGRKLGDKERVLKKKTSKNKEQHSNKECVVRSKQKRL